MRGEGPAGGGDSFEIAPRRREQPGGQPAAIPDYVPEDGGDFTLYVSDQVATGLRAYACSDPEREVGGVLHGRHYQANGRTVVAVTGFLPLPSDSTSRVHFAFDSRALLELHRQPRPTADSYLVGWFHSHPRLGDPFMSPEDRSLHSTNFQKEWHVSCVVGGGEWALPLGFWRMKGQSLVPIPEYYLHMTPAEPLGEQTRRFFRACVGEERPLNKLITRLLGLACLSVEQREALAGFFAPALFEELSRPTRAEVMGPVLSLIDLAIAVARREREYPEIEGLAGVLRRICFFEDSFASVLSSWGLRERLAVYGDRGYSLTPSGEEIACCDFVLKRVWSVALEPSDALVDLSCSAAGELWVLTERNRLVDLSDMTGPAPQLGSTNPNEEHFVSFPLHGLETGAQEISAGAESLWVRTRQRLYQFGTGAERGTEGEPLLLRVLEPAGPCVLIRGALEGEGIALSAATGILSMIDGEGKTLCSSNLGAPWTGWSLTSACSSSVGILALFDDSADGQLALFDGSSLALIHHFTYAREMGDNRATSIAVDECRRAFVKRGITVSFLIESGMPNPLWHHFGTGGHVFAFMRSEERGDRG